MPLYDFECTPCAYYTEIRQGIDDPSTHECPHCNQETLVKVFINSPSFFVRGEPNTIGQWADKNTRNMVGCNFNCTLYRNSFIARSLPDNFKVNLKPGFYLQHTTS